MKIISGIDTSTSVYNLIAEADRLLVIICPFVNAHTQNEKVIAAAMQKVSRTFIVTRPNEDGKRTNKLDFLKKVDENKYRYGTLNGLHSKIYMNEKECIITSFNMIDSTARQNYEVGTILRKEEHPDEYVAIGELAIEVLEDSSIGSDISPREWINNFTMGSLYKEFAEIHKYKIKQKFESMDKFYNALCLQAKKHRDFSEEEHYKGSNTTLLRLTKIPYPVYKKLLQSDFLN